jgi:uncharacterized membrane protein
MFCPENCGEVRAQSKTEVQVARIEETIEVDVPVRTAYNQWTQFEDFPLFMQGIEDVRQLDDNHVRWVADIGGRKKEWEAEIIAQIPDRRIAWRSVSGAMNAGAVEFKPLADDETEVLVRLEYETEGALEAIGGALQTATLRVKENLLLFKKFIEHRGSETGAWRGEVHPTRR